MGVWTILALAVLASDTKPVTSFALTNAQWWENCPRVLTQPQMVKRGLMFQPVEYTAPKYPDIQDPPEASVELELRVGTDGRVLDARIVTTSDERFNEPSLTSVRTWRYKPPVVDGEATCLAISATIDYRPPS